MLDKIKGMITINKAYYEEVMQEIKDRKYELNNELKKVKKLEKVINKTEIEGLKVEIPSNEEIDKELMELDKCYKIVKSMLRRYDTISQMYELDITLE